MLGYASTSDEWVDRRWGAVQVKAHSLYYMPNAAN